MRVLLTNDDGFHAAGIQILKEVVSEFASDLWMIAPSRDCSGVGRSISVNVPIVVQQVSPNEFIVDGTPVDSVLVALHRIMSSPPDLVLSGINCGSNVGSKVLYSGTIAAATAAAAMGISSIALSQEYGYRNEKDGSRSKEIDWSNSRKCTMQTIEQLLKNDQWNRKAVMSVNIPRAEIKGTIFAEQGEYCPSERIEEVQNTEGHASYMIREVNREVPLKKYQKVSRELLSEGYVVITPVGSDMTDHQTLSLLLSKC